ncbi:hypothetical protein [uncultured Winogradskyella sp.]|uniref:hypothetical protein n=1 Tax=uncultured Winogradskyella sp. TaxID=395353 RepID=UPI00262B426C|nr:hypothetical protein [uncultured Winogradskyella sp.]
MSKRVPTWLPLAIILLFNSCDIQKKAIKNKEDRTISEVEERTIKRAGDTVRYTVPKITYKDTTIYTVNRQGTTLRTVYDNSGQIEQIDCISSLIEVTERLERMTEEVIKSKDREKTEEFDSSIILYGFIGVGILLAIGLFFITRFLNQNAKAMNLLLEKLP